MDSKAEFNSCCCRACRWQCHNPFNKRQAYCSQHELLVAHLHDELHRNVRVMLVEFGMCTWLLQVIMNYLNKKFGWGPQDDESQAHIEQILAVVVDAVADGRLAFHPKDFYATHKIQVGAAAYEGCIMRGHLRPRESL